MRESMEASIGWAAGVGGSRASISSIPGSLGRRLGELDYGICDSAHFLIAGAWTAEGGERKRCGRGRDTNEYGESGQPFPGPEPSIPSTLASLVPNSVLKALSIHSSIFHLENDHRNGPYLWIHEVSSWSPVCRKTRSYMDGYPNFVPISRNRTWAHTRHMDIKYLSQAPAGLECY